ncbi:MAG: histidine kinase [Eubacteriales bacterium]
MKMKTFSFGEHKNTNRKKHLPIKWKMVLVLFFGWLIPLLFLTILTVYINSEQVNKQINTTVEISIDKAVDNCNHDLENSIAASRNASYFSNIKDANQLFQRHGDEQQLYTMTTEFLQQQFQYNNFFISTILYYYDNPEQLYYTYRNQNTNYYVDSIKWFEEQATETIQNELMTMESDTKFIVIEDRLYMMRNILDAGQNFKPIAGLIMEMNVEYLFYNMNAIWNYQESAIYINEDRIIGDRFLYDNNENCIVKTSYVEEQRIDYVISLDSNIWVKANSTIPSILVSWLLMMMPLIVVISLFFHRYVVDPINTLVRAVEKIEHEEYGYQIPVDVYRQEFKYLAVAYNHMSSSLKKQFEQIYLEELASKDAKISALQLQINPHFLNNTLEIINWEARMVDNYKVSEMIESLSVMLEATINRKGDNMVLLAEELSYVEAYLFIIGQRFGKKLKIMKEIDESLVRCKVPRLIIQPIIENAVEHGVNIQKQATIQLKIYGIEEKLYIEIIDNGTLSDQDKEKIALLLSDKKIEEGYGHTSIGIRNVNSRLQFIYGESYRLTIKSNKENHTVSTLVMKIED